MAKLIINSGINSLGNFTDNEISLTNIDPEINYIKTLVNGQWKSWTKSTPDIFQGMLSIEKGRGFISNTSSNVEIDISDTPVDINTIDISTGLNFFCFPYVDKKITNGLIPRVRNTFLKTLTSAWKSWTTGTPDAFQGFTTINKANGYVCNVTTIFDVYLDNNNRTNNTGVKIGTDELNSLDNNNSGTIVEFPIDAIYKSINYNVVTINTALPLNNLWVNINNVIKLIKYPTELAGSRFFIKETNLETINYGLLTDTVANTYDYGSITINNTINNKDLGNINSGYGIANIIYSGLFTPNSNNSESNPLVLTDIINLNSIELMYNKSLLGTTPSYEKMYLNVDGVKIILEFATEYSNKSFTIIKNNKEFNGLFIKNNSFITL